MTYHNLIEYNQMFLKKVENAFISIFNTNVILVDNYGYSILENCLIVYLFRRLRNDIQQMIESQSISAKGSKLETQFLLNTLKWMS